jgi:phosphoketolase
MDATLKTQARDQATARSGDSQAKPAPLTIDELRKLDAYWRASNYLSVGQIYIAEHGDAMPAKSGWKWGLKASLGRGGTSTEGDNV